MQNKIPASCTISDTTILKGEVVLGENCVIEGYCTLENVIVGNNVHMIDSKLKNCKVGDNTIIKEWAVIEDSTIESDSQVLQSNITSSTVGRACVVGPFAHLRPKSTLLGYNKIGAFVQVKNSTIGEHTTASHLAYIGDATIGKYVNIGCGVIFVNYDGKQKFHTSVGDYCFIGCHTNLIAPIHVGEHCFIAAGATLTKDVPANSFVIGRSTPTIKTNTKFNQD